MGGICICRRISGHTLFIPTFVKIMPCLKNSRNSKKRDVVIFSCNEMPWVDFFFFQTIPGFRESMYVGYDTVSILTLPYFF